MSKLRIHSWLMGLFGALVVVGFYLGSAVGTLVAAGSLASYVSRATVAVLSVLLLLLALRAPVIRRQSLVFLLFLFWLLYAGKAFYVYAIDASVPLGSAVYAVAYFSATCLLPALVPHFSRQFCWNDKFTIVLCLFAMLAFGASILVQGAWTAFGVEQGRLSLETMGPIQVGHLGATGCIVAMAAQARGQALFRVCLFVGGLVLMALSGTRSALVAVILCLGILAYRNARMAKSANLLGLVVLSALVGSLYMLYEVQDVAVIERLSRLTDASDDTGSGRLSIYSEALSDFLGSPIIGAGLTTMRSGFYPHNLFLEAYYATGLIGGTAVVLYVGSAISSVWRHVLYGGQVVVLPSMLFIQYLVASMLSGAIYSWGQLWFLAALLLTVGETRESRGEHARMNAEITRRAAP